MYQTASYFKAVTFAFFLTLLGAALPATELSAAQLTLSWTDNSTDEDGFRIERKTGSSGSYAEISIVAANVVSYADSSLSDATNYCYRLRAYNTAGTSAYSNEQCATTASTPPPPPPPSFLLTVVKAGTGSGTVTATGINCGSDCTHSVSTSTQMVLTAVAASGSTFAGWTGTGCSSGTVTLASNITCTATFNLNSFTLTISKAGNGSGTVTATGISCGSDCSHSVSTSTQMVLTAVAASGSTFAGWTGTGCSSGTVTLASNITCTATFNLNSFTLTISKAGNGSGTVTATGISCGSDCSHSVSTSTQMVLTAVAASGSTFAGWTGTGCSSGTVTLASNITCTATFNLNSFTLTISKAGNGSGTVTATGISCGSDCSEKITNGTQVVLTAVAASGSTFAGWTGTGCSSGTVTMTGNLTCTATFNLNSFTLTVAKSGTGSGTVTASFAGSVATATTIVLEADSGNLTAPMVIQSDPAASGGQYVEIPEGAGNNYSGATFGGPGEASFSINIPQSGTYALWARTIAPTGTSDSFYVTRNGSLLSEWHVPSSTTWKWNKIADVSLTAGSLNLAFRQREDGIKIDQLILTDNLDSYPGIDCGSDCSESVSSGSQVVLTATAASGSTFAGWTGTGCSSGTVTVTGNMTCTATFNINSFTLTVAKSGTGSGMVTATGINCGSDCSEKITSGTQVVLTAVAASGSTFAGWTGTGCSSGTVTVTGNMTCTATFNINSFTLTVAKSGTGSGTVTATGINCGSDCSESVSSGMQVLLTAVPASGSTFAGWTGTGCSSTVTVTGNMTCTAIFNLLSFTLTVAKAGNGTGTVTGTGINCGSDCTHTASGGTQIILTATASTSSIFSGWMGTGCSSGTVTVSANMTCTATFNSATIAGDRIGVYRPSTGQWFFDANGNYAWDSGIDITVPTFSAAEAQPVVGDWSGIGDTQLGLLQRSTLQWHLDLNNNKAIDGCTIDACYGPFGEPTDIPVAGKWNTRGNYRIGVFRPSTGYWYLDRNANGNLDRCKTDGCVNLKNYQTGDLPVIGDWSGDGISQIGLFRPSTGQWFLDRSSNRAWDGCKRDRCIESFGSAGDLPVSGDWDGTGDSKIGVWRPSTGQWFLDYNGNGVWDGCSVDICTFFGSPGDLPVVGKW